MVVLASNWLGWRTLSLGRTRCGTGEWSAAAAALQPGRPMRSA